MKGYIPDLEGHSTSVLALIVGLFILWLASTGKLDRVKGVLAQASPQPAAVKPIAKGGLLPGSNLTPILPDTTGITKESDIWKLSKTPEGIAMYEKLRKAGR